MKKIMFNDHYGLTQAVLDGRKTQTRRIISPQPTLKENCGINWKGHAYGVGMNLQETYRNFISGTRYSNDARRFRVGEIVAVAQSYKDCGYAYNQVLYRSVPMVDGYRKESAGNQKGWNNKMFVCANLMPHQIRIADVRIERLQDISDEDCIKEGIREFESPALRHYGFSDFKEERIHPYESPREAYSALIDKVSDKGTWDSNPYVFVYEFELIK